MCGIVGYIGPKPVVPVLLDGLRRLEYRGYDSAGVAVVKDGAIDKSHVLGSIGDVLLGRVAGRTSADDITLFRSLGMVAEDLVTAQYVLSQATQRNVGSLVSL